MLAKLGAISLATGKSKYATDDNEVDAAVGKKKHDTAVTDKDQEEG